MENYIIFHSPSIDLDFIVSSVMSETPHILLTYRDRYLIAMQFKCV